MTRQFEPKTKRSLNYFAQTKNCPFQGDISVDAVRKPLGECAVGADIVLPTLGLATVTGEPQSGNVKVIVDNNRVGKVIHLRRGLMVFDIGSISPNIKKR